MHVALFFIWRKALFLRGRLGLIEKRQSRVFELSFGGFKDNMHTSW